jgi:hypothetical protein
MLQSFSIVEVFSALPMIFALESFWNAYEQHESVFDDRHSDTQLLTHEMLHNIVMFVCTFFRYVDSVCELQGTLIEGMAIFHHLDRFGSLLLHENHTLYIKSVKCMSKCKSKRAATAKLDYQAPRALVIDDVISCLLENGVVCSCVSGAERVALRRWVRIDMMRLTHSLTHSLTYSPIC